MKKRNRHTYDEHGICFECDKPRLELVMGDPILDKLEANRLYLMTSELKDAFLAAGCDPACHKCGRKIQVLADFVLLTVPSESGFVDEMRCYWHSKYYIRRRAMPGQWRPKTHAERFAEKIKKRGGAAKGYSRPSLEATYME